jgi:hypothetical protein
MPRRLGRATGSAALAAVSCLAIAGCGGGSSKAGEKSVAGVRAALNEYVSKLDDGNFSQACGLMTEAGRAEVGQGNASRCPERLQLGRAFLTPAIIDGFHRLIDRATVQIHGDEATVPRFSGGGTSTLKYDGGRWRIGPRARH